MRWAAAPILGTSGFSVEPITATGTRRASHRVSLHRDRCLPQGRASVGLIHTKPGRPGRSTTPACATTTWTRRRTYALPRGGARVLPSSHPELAASNLSWGSRTLFVRKDWMEKLGIDDPQTAEEFIEMCVRFVTDDPDGNGEDDTLGFTLRAIWPFQSQTFGYGYTDGSWIKVVTSTTWATRPKRPSSCSASCANSTSAAAWIPTSF